VLANEKRRKEKVTAGVISDLGTFDILSKFGDTTGDGNVAVLHRTWETVRKDLILRVLYTSNSEKVDK